MAVKKRPEIKQLPPEIAREVSGRLYRDFPKLHHTLQQERIETTGRDFEALLRVVWLHGYAECLHDIDEMPGPNPHLPELGQWILNAKARR